MAARKRKRQVTRAQQTKLLKRVGKSIPRDVMIDAIKGIAGDNEKAVKMWMMLSDPTFKQYTLATVARDCDMSFAEVHDLFRKAKILEGTFEVYQDFPNLMSDIRDDARTRMKSCPLCDGDGQVTRDKKKLTCKECDGTGQVRVIGDKNARQAILEMAGLIGNRAPMVAIQQNFTGDESHEDTIGAVSQLVRPPRPQLTTRIETIDNEVTK